MNFSNHNEFCTGAIIFNTKILLSNIQKTRFMSHSLFLRTLLCLFCLLPLSELKAAPQAPKTKPVVKKHAAASKTKTAARPMPVKTNAVKPMGKVAKTPKPQTAN